MRQKSFFLVATALLLGACSYQAPTHVKPSYNVYTPYTEKLDLNLALHVDASQMAGNATMSGWACSAHTYPVDARQSFTSSVKGTFDNLVSAVTLVDGTMSGDQLAANGYDALAQVVVRDMTVEMIAIQRFFGGDMEADAEITAALTVSSRAGRVVDTIVEGSEDARLGQGWACNGGADAVSKAVEDAMKETVERLGERLVNAPRLRTLAEEKHLGDTRKNK